MLDQFRDFQEPNEVDMNAWPYGRSSRGSGGAGGGGIGAGRGTGDDEGSDPSEHVPVDTQEKTEILDEANNRLKDMVATAVVQQMLVKANQVGLDAFLLKQKWLVGDQYVTVAQWMQTFAQMLVGYAAKTGDAWNQFWNGIEQRRDEVQQARLKTIAGI